jgi:hypothetical protein
VRADVDETHAPGRLEGRITLWTNLPRHLQTLKVSLRGDVRPDLQARPAAFLFTRTSPHRKSLELVRPSGQPAVIDSIRVVGVPGVEIREGSATDARSLWIVEVDDDAFQGSTQEGQIIARLMQGVELAIPIVVLEVDRAASDVSVPPALTPRESAAAP